MLADPEQDATEHPLPGPALVLEVGHLASEHENRRAAERAIFHKRDQAFRRTTSRSSWLPGPPARTSTGPCGKPWWLSHTAQSASAAFRNVAKPCGRPSFDLLPTPGAVDTPITWHGARDYIIRQRREALGHLEGTHGSGTCLPVVFLVP